MFFFRPTKTSENTFLGDISLKLGWKHAMASSSLVLLHLAWVLHHMGTFPIPATDWECPEENQCSQLVMPALCICALWPMVAPGSSQKHNACEQLGPWNGCPSWMAHALASQMEKLCGSGRKVRGYRDSRAALLTPCCAKQRCGASGLKHSSNRSIIFKAHT